MNKVKNKCTECKNKVTKYGVVKEDFCSLLKIVIDSENHSKISRCPITNPKKSSVCKNCTNVTVEGDTYACMASEFNFVDGQYYAKVVECTEKNKDGSCHDYEPMEE